MKLFYFLLPLLLIVVSFGFISDIAKATVGGPTFIHTFTYNHENESVYYISKSFSGRGCPPELRKVSLNSGISEVVYSCNEGQGIGASNVATEINKITNNFKNLQPINLHDNNISIDVDFVGYEKLEPESNESEKFLEQIQYANFIASVYKDDKKIIDLPIKGCNVKQPFIFGGYAIPGFEKKIVLLLSTKGDCFEGGYIYETLHVVGGVDNLDKAYLNNFYKTSSALIPNEGALVVFESDNISRSTSLHNESIDTGLDVTQERGFSAVTLIIVGVVSLVIGLFVGVVLPRIKHQVFH